MRDIWEDPHNICPVISFFAPIQALTNDLTGTTCQAAKRKAQKKKKKMRGTTLLQQVARTRAVTGMLARSLSEKTDATFYMHIFANAFDSVSLREEGGQEHERKKNGPARVSNNSGQRPNIMHSTSIH